MPNWNRFKNIVSQMITTDLGAEEVIIITPGEITYDFDTGEQVSELKTEPMKLALIPTNKDDLKDIKISSKNKIGIMAGVSTPKIIVEEIINKLKEDYKN